MKQCKGDLIKIYIRSDRDFKYKPENSMRDHQKLLNMYYKSSGYAAPSKRRDVFNNHPTWKLAIVNGTPVWQKVK